MPPLNLRRLIVGLIVAQGMLSACATSTVATAEPDVLKAGQITSLPDRDVQTPVAPRPAVTPLITPTPIPTTSSAATRAAPTPVPSDQRTYNLCVSIVSDSNGYGHVTYQIGDQPDRIGIVYVTPLWVPLKAHLTALGLDYLEVRDRSLSAGGLTIRSANYLQSIQLSLVKQDRCKFVIITAFLPDVAVNLAAPGDYVANLNLLVSTIVLNSAASKVLVLNYYQTFRADYTATNSGLGLTTERIDAFNQALDAACQPAGVIGQFGQVECIDVRPFFADMGRSYVLGETTRQDYEASLYDSTSYSAIIDDYFAQNPTGTIIGDGIHLSEPGRDRWADRLAKIIFDLNAWF